MVPNSVQVARCWIKYTYEICFEGLELIELPSRGPLTASQGTHSTTRMSFAHRSSPMIGAKGLQRRPDLLSLSKGHISSTVSQEVAQYDRNPVVVEGRKLQVPLSPN